MDKAKNIIIDELFGAIDLWAADTVHLHRTDGASVYNPHNAKELAKRLYAAGYRKQEPPGRTMSAYCPNCGAKMETEK